jgi:hypothetical protein
MDELSSVVLRHNESHEAWRAIAVKTGQPVVPVNDPVMGSMPHNEDGPS